MKKKRQIDRTVTLQQVKSVGSNTTFYARLEMDKEISGGITGDAFSSIGDAGRISPPAALSPARDHQLGLH